MDGLTDKFEGYEESDRPLATQQPIDSLPKKLPADNLYVPDADSEELPGPPEIKRKTLCGQVLSSFPQYRRRNFLLIYDVRRTYEEVSPDRKELDAACWLSAHVQHSWHVQTRAMLHTCGPSCWKYNKNGTRICRHHCYHITIFEPDPSSENPAEKPMKLRRDGRPLNNQLFIQEDTAKGKRGRICPITVMPFETMTNYCVAGSLGCNFDHQSLLYLPPQSVLKLAALPNIGPKPEFAHMARTEGDLVPKWILDLNREADAESLTDDIESCEELVQELDSECLSAFQDAHNTGFYINEYTTKINSLGDKLLEGLRRASEKVLKLEEPKTNTEVASKDGRSAEARQQERARIKAVLKKFVYLMNSLQVKSCSELLFPMLFDHMSFSTHRTWEMNMTVPFAKVSIFICVVNRDF